jgi:hypothetical protein
LRRGFEVGRDVGLDGIDLLSSRHVFSFAFFVEGIEGTDAHALEALLI